VLSLVALAAHMGRAECEARPDGRPLRGCARARARALFHACLRLEEWGRAHWWLEQAVERERAAGSEPEDLLVELARLTRRIERAKRQG
jgi:hypothetical protein